MEPVRSLHDLLDLQDVDAQIDRLIDQRKSLPELVDYRAAHEETLRLGSARDETGGRLREIELAIDKTTGELEITQQKAGGEEMRLYAGGLSARDADYLRREVELLKAKVGGMEDEVLELMESREEIESDLARLEAELEAETDHKAELEAGIRESWRLIDAELAVKEHRKVEIMPLVDDDLIELYEELRGSRDGRAVGALNNGVCGACHLILSSAEENEARRQNPPRCVHCRAILVP
ncbi:MAG: C4-type zinc ribbon domain-containing protein [Actinomycetota bacterium]|nr:C4-type zinc ribbon domain-containing protein [Actinomycetota bacterium]